MRSKVQGDLTILRPPYRLTTASLAACQTAPTRRSTGGPRRNLAETGRMDALRTMIGLSKLETELVIGAVLVPTLVVMGTKDPDFPDPARKAELVARLTCGTTVLIDRAGHYPHAEMPDVVGTRVVDFLRGGRDCSRPAWRPPPGEPAATPCGP